MSVWRVRMTHLQYVSGLFLLGAYGRCPISSGNLLFMFVVQLYPRSLSLVVTNLGKHVIHTRQLPRVYEKTRCVLFMTFKDFNLTAHSKISKQAVYGIVWTSRCVLLNQWNGEKSRCNISKSQTSWGKEKLFQITKKSIPTHCYCGILLGDCFKHVLEKQTLRNNGPLISLLSSLWNNEGVQTVEVQYSPVKLAHYFLLSHF